MNYTITSNIPKEKLDKAEVENIYFVILLS